MGVHEVETYEREDGKRGWRVTVGDDVIATDGGQGYNNEEDALAGFFGMFFDQWGETFLPLYTKWQGYAGQAYEVPPEAQEGVPVMLRDADAPNYESEATADATDNTGKP